VFPEILDMNPFISTTGIKESQKETTEQGEEVATPAEKVEPEAKEPEESKPEVSTDGAAVEKPPDVAADSASSLPATEEALPSLEAPETPVVNGKAKV